VKNNHAYEDLLTYIKQTAALEQVAGLISWDQETMMPKTGTPARSEQLAAMTSVIHARRSNKRIEDWIAAIDESSLDAVATANVRETRRCYEKAIRVPSDLVEEIARITALAQGQWAEARADNNFGAFAPTLDTIVNLKREEARCLTNDGMELYDALLDEFEPGMKTDALATLFGRLRPGLTDLREKISQKQAKTIGVTGKFDDAKQMEMARRLASVFNYDWDGGRIDKAVHPFSSGYRSDSRITTRVNPDNVFDCLYSTIHEVGHSNYEQGRDPAMDRTPAGSYASMGVHESQSRMLENQIGRSRAFMEWLYPQMSDVFGDIGVSSPDELFAAVNRVETGFIRTESDEVHYNLHVLMRFDLELALIRDELQVADLETAWNDRFAADFGRQVDKSSNGVLQDVHWSVGLFGYFPTYSLGNIYAAELFAKMGSNIDDMDTCISKGDLAPLSDWLKANVHVHGHIYSAPDLMKNVIGSSSDETALTTYLNAKFGDLYNL